MSEPFRTRSFTPVPPAERPRRTRRGVRVVVTDGSSVLLLADTDPGLPGSRWWVTPGGGIDADESEVDAAVRELAEETGLVTEASALIGPVMTRVAAHGYSDQICEQTESFYLLRTDRFEIDVSGHTPEEQLTLVDHAWVPLDALADLPDPVWPSGLAELIAGVDDRAAWPGDVGWIEESSVPIGD